MSGPLGGGIFLTHAVEYASVCSWASYTCGVRSAIWVHHLQVIALFVVALGNFFGVSFHRYVFVFCFICFSFHFITMLTLLCL